jgi:beta-glucosidase/6-phospho-beta-glucosidase/beta-galactosidase
MKNELVLGVRPDQFIWASGIEDTFVPQTKPDHRALDEYQLMEHYEHWRTDLSLARDLGLNAIRWGVPWYRVEPSPGKFEWGWVDDVLSYIVQDLQITPIIDLMHYGCPFWLVREFANKSYPAAVSEYIGAFADRYRRLVRWYTPLNEPVVNALMCGKRGLWPPYLRGDGGYIRLILQLAKGIIESVRVLRSVDPDAVIVHVEACGLSRPARQDLEALAIEDNHRGYICYDLLTGRVDPSHPLFLWLVRNGAPPDDLVALAERRITLDAIGMNFYPQWSTRELFVSRKGKVAIRFIEHEGTSFGNLIVDYYQRYRVPILITETSAYGREELRSRWLEASIGTIRQLRAKGIPVLGYTWFPMFTMIDWRYRFGRRPLESYRLELGLYRLDDEQSRHWVATPLVQQFRSYLEDSTAAVGEFQTVVEDSELRSTGTGLKRRAT